MLLRLLLTLFAVVNIGFSAQAQSNDVKINSLYEALRLSDVIQIMRDEGLAYGDVLANDLFPGRNSDDWQEMIALIYDLPNMTYEVQSAFNVELTAVDVQPALDFFQSEQGQTIVELEISARVAMMDDSIEEAANDSAEIAAIDETSRFLLVQRFVEANDLIETNIVGAMNSNYAFMTGLLDGGALPSEFSEDEILTDVWAQEPAIRMSTSEWAYSFLLLAFQPLEEDEIEAYIAFSETEAGQQLNDALFASFDGMLEGISRDLGLAASRLMTQQEL